MIKHVVMWKLKESAHGRSRGENAALIKDKLESLNGKIPGVIKLEAGIACSPGEGGAHLVLYSEFGTKEDLENYRCHREYKDFLPFIDEAAEMRMCADYEVPSPRVLRGEVEETISSFDSSAGEFSNTIGRLRNYNAAYDYVAAGLRDGDRVLDLGCGPANISAYLCRSAEGIDVTGVDLSPEMLRIAETEIPSGKFFCDDILVYRGEKPSDLVVAGFAIPFMNLDETERFLLNCRRNTVPGGRLYLSFMEGNREGFESPSFNRDVRIYIYYHEKEKIFDLLEKSGFRLVKEWAFDYLENDCSVTTDIVFVAERV